jgi:hypothetical protein
MTTRGYGVDGLPPLTAVPAARSRAAVLKVRLVLVLGALLLSSVMGVFAAVSFLSFDPPTVDLEASKPRGMALAELSAYAYLSGEALPLPALAGQELPRLDPTAVKVGTPRVEVVGPLRWDGFEVRSLPSGVPFETHRFLFYRIDPLSALAAGTDTLSPPQRYQLMLLTVQVAFPPGGNPVLASRPYFAPANWTGSDRVVADYTDASPVNLPSNSVEQLRSWASAWAADDSETLRLLTGDQTSGVRYVGLGGYQFVEMRVVSAIQVRADGFIVRARLALSGANGVRVEMDMDITVDSASTGLPNIVGWGPAGSGMKAPSDVRVIVGR